MVTWAEFSDDGGYRPELLAPEILAKIEQGDWRRAGGGVVCTACGKTYSEHRVVVHTGGLKQLCNGDLVHL